MKFILNEHKKFILEEKYILKEADQLTEASAVDVAVLWTNNFKNTLEKTKTVLEKFITYAGISKNKAATKDTFNKVKGDINKAWEEMEISLSMPDRDKANAMMSIKAELEQYINVLKVVKQEIKDEKSEYKLLELDAGITKLTALNSKDTWDKKDLNTLIDHHSWIKSTILPLFDTADIDTSESNVERLKATCNNCLKLIDEINADLPETFTNFDKTSLTTYISAMQYSEKVKEWADKWNAVTDNKLHGLVKANLDTLLAQVEQIELNYKKINSSNVLQSVKAIKKKQAEKDESEKIQKNSQKADWETEYHNCKSEEDVKKFWERYYSVEWEENAEIVKTLQSALIVEFENFGWSTISNPFLFFLKNHLEDCLKQSDNIQGKYFELHNAVSNGTLQAKDLRETGKFKSHNLIFNPNLYKLSATDMSQYLKFQAQLTQENYRLVGPIKAVYDKNPEIVLSNIMLEGGDVNNMNMAIVPKGKLKSITLIRNILNTVLNIDKSDVKEVVSEDFIDSILKEVTSAEKAKKLLAFLFIGLRRDYTSLLDKINQDLNYKLSGLTPPSYSDIKDEYERYKFSAKFTSDQLKKLILGLAETAKI